MSNPNAVFENIVSAVYSGDAGSVVKLIQQALDQGVPPGDIVDEGLIKGMDAVGVDFKEGTLFIPEVLIAAQSMHEGMNMVRPLLTEKSSSGLGKFVIGTVQGDLHDIGKNLVAMMMEGAGFEVVDLGIDVPVEKFVDVVRDDQPTILGLSALLSTTMNVMENTIEAIDQAGLRDKIKILVGGAPVSRTFAEKIGADGYASDAAGAVNEARKILGL